MSNPIYRRCGAWLGGMLLVLLLSFLIANIVGINGTGSVAKTKTFTKNCNFSNSATPPTKAATDEDCSCVCTQQYMHSANKTQTFKKGAESTVIFTFKRDAAGNCHCDLSPQEKH